MRQDFSRTVILEFAAFAAANRHLMSPNITLQQHTIHTVAAFVFFTNLPSFPQRFQMIARSGLVLILVASACVSPSCVAEDFVFHHENVLGTSLELRVACASHASAKQAERRVLDDIQRLVGIFSSYNQSSEFSRFVKSSPGTEFQLSPELYAALAMCDEWRHASNNAFHPAAEEFVRLWTNAQKESVLPAPAALNNARQSVLQPHWKLNSANQSATRLSACSLSLNAIAKGYILDLVAQEAMRLMDGVTGIMLNIGGDIRVAGSMIQTVDIADPANDGLGASPVAQVVLTSGAIATSGSSERHFQIGQTRYSHILNPRTGQPVHESASATVVAPFAHTADALATICSVLTPSESLALVNSIDGADCLLVTADGEILASANWPLDESKTQDKKQSAAKTAAKKKPTGHEFQVDFEISRAQNSRRYRRPYVAVWIEDKDKFPVKTLSLFLMQNNPGPRWYRDVRRWYRDDQIRKLVDSTDIIKTVSKPTRNPGKYKIAWDGRDDLGKLLKPGKYTLFIEAAREHGTYQLIKQEFEFGKSFEKKKLKGNAEISAASVSYKARKPAGAGKGKS